MKKNSKILIPTNDERNRKYFEFLTTYSPFINAVKNTRKESCIPLNGFSDEKCVKEWQIDLNKKGDEFNKHERTKRMENQISNDLKAKKVDVAMANKLGDLISSEDPVNKFSNSIRDIIKRFKIPVHFDMALRVFVLYNKLSWIPLNNFGFKIEKDKLSFNIYSNLTKEEINNLIKYIRMFNKTLPHVKKLSPNTDVQLSVEKSIDMKNDSGEKITAKDRAKEYFGENSKKQRVYDAKRELDRKRKKLFG